MLLLNAQKLEKVLNGRIEKDISEKTLIGASCAVMQGGEVICKVIKGAAHPETAEPLREDSIFRLASMTKLLTVAGLLLQIEQNKITYETKISDFFPGFNNKWIAHVDENKNIIRDKKAGAPILIRHLLTHTGGLGSGPAGDLQRERLSEAQKATVASVTDFYQNEAVLDFEPGSALAYSALAAFDIMARIIELLSDMGFDEYLKKYIFDPLGTKDMTFTPSDGQWARMVAMHDNINGKPVALDWGKIIFPGLPQTNMCGGGGLVSTLDDYCRFVRMLMAGGIYNGNEILAEGSVKAMGTQQIPDSLASVDITWGAGCMIYKNFPPVPPGCFGWSGAWGTHMWVDPANNIGAVYMRNSVFGGGAGAETARNFEKDVYSAVI